MKVCPECKKKHEGRGIRCSKQCYYKSRKGKPPWNYQRGGYKRPNHSKKLKELYRLGVMKSWNKGKKYHCHSKKWKEKLSKKFKENNPTKSKEVRRKISLANKKRDWTLESKIKLSESVKGTNNPNYKNGGYLDYLRSKYSRKLTVWRRQVLVKDNYKCVNCNSKENLETHHIKSFAKYPKLRFEVKNGKTLCRKCHRKKN